MHPLDLPKGIDVPPSLLWRLDDLIPLILMLMIGILADRPLLFVLLVPADSLARTPSRGFC